MRTLLVSVLCILFFNSQASDSTESYLAELNIELNRKDSYELKRERQLKQLKRELQKTPQRNLYKRYALCSQIYNSYKSYQFDSAFTYVNKLVDLSRKLESKPREYDSKVKLSFILLSSGMFKETFDSLKDVNAQALTDSTKIEYYSILTRAYYDLAAFVNDKHFAPKYNTLANQYIDSAIQISKAKSFNKAYLIAYKAFKNNDFNTAEQCLKNLMTKPGLNMHELAITASTLSNLYTSTKKPGPAVNLLIRAAIADIKSSTKETVALFWLAGILHKNGDVLHAYSYIRHAMADAEFYGARQRQLQISTVLPLIAAEKLNYSEQQKTRFLIYLLSITSLALVIVVFSIVVVKQLKKLRAKERIIEETNAELAAINQQLMEGTRIKEEYIGYFFNVISGYIAKLEKLKHSVDMKLSVKKYDDIRLSIDTINIKKERETLFYTFDHVFLKIFPNFVQEFNSLLKPEDQVWPKEHEVLSTDLRIFALVRMGIDDNATIANILEYSEKTIYVYRTRLKAKALIHGDQFEKRLMAIRAETEKPDKPQPHK